MTANVKGQFVLAIHGFDKPLMSGIAGGIDHPTDRNLIPSPEFFNNIGVEG
jgi:hypothetical protein